MANRVVEMVVRILAEAKDFGKEMSKAEKDLEKVGKAAKDVGRIMGLAGAAITGALGIAVKKAADFEQQWAEVTTLMGDETPIEKVEELKRGVRDLSERFGFELKDTVQAAYNALSAGVPPDNLISFMEEASKGAVGGVSDLTTTMNGMLSVMKGMDVQYERTGEVSDAFFTAIKFGRTTMDELAPAMGRVSGMAGQMGLSIQETLGTISAATVTMGNTERASTGLAQAFVNIIKPSKEAQEIQDMLGFTLDANTVKTVGWEKVLKSLTSVVNDAVVPGTEAYRMAMKNLEKVMEANRKKNGELNETGKEAASIQEKLAAGQLTSIDLYARLFGSIEAGQVIMALAAQNGEIFAASMKAQAEGAGAADLAYAKMAETLTTQLNQVKQILGGLAIDVGEVLIPVLKDLVENNLKPMIEHFREWRDVNRELHDGMVKWMAVLGPLAVALGGVAFVVEKLIVLFKGLWTIMAFVFGGGLVGLLAGAAEAFGLFIGGVTGSAAAMMAAAYAAAFAIGAVIGGAIGLLLGSLTPIKNFFSELGGLLNDKFSEWFDDKDGFLIGVVKTFLAAVYNAFLYYWNEIKIYVEEVVEDIKGAIQSIFDLDLLGYLQNVVSLINKIPTIDPLIPDSWLGGGGATEQSVRASGDRGIGGNVVTVNLNGVVIGSERDVKRLANMLAGYMLAAK